MQILLTPAAGVDVEGQQEEVREHAGATSSLDLYGQAEVRTARKLGQ
jgi:hypothetical protein